MDTFCTPPAYPLSVHDPTILHSLLGITSLGTAVRDDHYRTSPVPLSDMLCPCAGYSQATVLLFYAYAKDIRVALETSTSRQLIGRLLEFNRPRHGYVLDIHFGYRDKSIEPGLVPRGSRHRRTLDGTAHHQHPDCIRLNTRLDIQTTYTRQV